MSAENDYERICVEWLRSCSCAPKDKPEECEECTKGFLNAIKNLHRFRTLDSMWKFNFKSDIMLVVKKHNLKYISELVYDLYYNKGKSVREIAETIGVVKNTVILWMERWQFKTRSPGGNNRNSPLKDPKFISEIFDCKKTMTDHSTAIKYKCSVITVRKIWEGKHHLLKKDLLQ